MSPKALLYTVKRQSLLRRYRRKHESVAPINLGNDGLQTFYDCCLFSTTLMPQAYNHDRGSCACDTCDYHFNVSAGANSCVLPLRPESLPRSTVMEALGEPPDPLSPSKVRVVVVVSPAVPSCQLTVEGAAVAAESAPQNVMEPLPETPSPEPDRENFTKTEPSESRCAR